MLKYPPTLFTTRSLTYICSCLLTLLYVANPLSINAQPFQNLSRLEGYQTNTYYSSGALAQASEMAKRCDAVMEFYGPILNFQPEVILLVLSPDDWSRHTAFPVYGMPHYNDAKTLIVASEDNDFWRSFIPPLDSLSDELAHQISTTYSIDQHITMRGFFDLLAIHELGHAFHFQAGLNMQRKWMAELFANLFLHTYIAEKEPGLLPTISIFPQTVVSTTDKANLDYITLTDFESYYELIAQQYPNNYGWYQCRLDLAAAHIYDTGGITTLKNLWQELKDNQGDLDDATFVKLLTGRVHQSVADVPLKWNDK